MKHIYAFALTLLSTLRSVHAQEPIVIADFEGSTLPCDVFVGVTHWRVVD